MKYLVWIIILAAVIGGGSLYWSAREKAAAANANTTVQSATVERQTIEKLITANGKVASNRDVDIKCQASGTIKELPFKDVSAEVKPGQVVCELDPIDEQHLLDTATAVVVADQARLAEANLNWNIAKMSLVTTRMRNEASLASAKARATDAHAKADRTKALFESKLASQEDLETAQTTAAQADADAATAEAAIAELDQQKIGIDTKEQAIKEMEQSVKQDQFRADTAQQNVGYCTVKAPLADNESDPPRWFISSMLVNIAPGYIVQSGTSGFSAGTTLMTLSDLSHIFVLASVDESDIGQVQDPNTGAGQRARVTVDAYPGVEFEGRVQRVATKGVNTSNVVTFEVKIEIVSSNRMLLRPEMTATARIISASRPDVLMIPRDAFVPAVPGDASETPATATAPAVTGAAPGGEQVAGAVPTTRRGRGGRGRGRSGGGEVLGGATASMEGTVQVLKADNTQEARNVTVGLADDDNIEVIKGLDEGENVVRNKTGTDSRFRGQNPQQMIRGITGGGGRGR